METNPTPPSNQSPMSGDPSAIEQPLQEGSVLKINKRRKLTWWIVGSLVGLAILLIVAVAGAHVWYEAQLSSPGTGSGESARITVQEGSSVATIAKQLESDGVIKSALAFEVYYRLNRPKTLQAGVYVIEEGADVPAIISKLGSGKNDEFQLTFTPGESVLDVQQTLIKAGYTQADVTAALNKQYTNYPMMAQRPSGSDIEGFIFPDTYNFGTDFTVENVLARPMQYMQAYIEEQNLEAAFKRQGLSLYEGVILASIIQKEVNNKTDMSHVSQVFHSRLKQGIPLGSDPTFVYPAKRNNQTPHPGLESPYNTYKIRGLPPGPIANPGKEALMAAANPRTDTSDLYFVAGDDGTTYFSKTNAEHEALTRKYCNERCRLDIF